MSANTAMVVGGGALVLTEQEVHKAVTSDEVKACFMPANSIAEPVASDPNECNYQV